VTDRHEANKAAIAPWRAAMYDWDPAGVSAAARAVFAPDAVVHLAFPFEDLDGGVGLVDTALAPLAAAWPDIERRDMIVTVGTTEAGNDWVGCCGAYVGTFTEPWLDIPPTRRPVSMRFHEFYRLVDGRIVEMQALWDIPEVMMQAGAWPMGPSLGRDWFVPGPATQDGIVSSHFDPDRSATSLQVVLDMLGDMGRHPHEPVEAMQLERYWHPKFKPLLCGRQLRC